MSIQKRAQIIGMLVEGNRQIKRFQAANGIQSQTALQDQRERLSSGLVVKVVRPGGILHCQL